MALAGDLTGLAVHFDERLDPNAPQNRLAGIGLAHRFQNRLQFLRVNFRVTKHHHETAGQRFGLKHDAQLRAEFRILLEHIPLRSLHQHAGRCVFHAFDNVENRTLRIGDLFGEIPIPKLWSLSVM